MLIIFDLDDTLIDTTGCITYYKLEDALLAMHSQGLEVPDFAEALALLRRLDCASESARDTLCEFLEILGADSKVLDIGIQQIYNTDIQELAVHPLEGAVELLEKLSVRHQLALVSNGIYTQQMDKLKKAGIDSRIFSKIAVSEETCKRSRYQMLVEALGFAPAQVVACGDRISIDLVPAKELGFKTIQVRWGRGLNGAERKSEVDHMVSSLKEIEDIVNRF